MLKLLIADASEEYPTAIAALASGTYDIQICHEGHETMDILRSFQPDLLILDLMLPGLDGISILQMAHEENICPSVLAVSCFISDFIVRKLDSLGVMYVMKKPCDLRASLSRLEDLAGQFVSSHESIDGLVTKVLISLGMPVKLRGYHLLQQAIASFVHNPGQMITKELYPEVAEKNNATVAQVERAIRSAISAAWDNRDEEQWHRYFSPGKDGSLERPTNAAFISGLADRIRLQQLHDLQNL